MRQLSHGWEARHVKVKYDALAEAAYRLGLDV